MRIKNKIITVLLLVVMSIMTVLVSGCEKGRESSTNLKFLHIWPEHAEAMKEVINDFMMENPDIIVDIQESNFNDVDTTLKNLWGTKDMPDVFFQWSHYMYKWVPEGIPLDITDIANEVKDELISDGAPLNSGTINGKVYNMPFRTTGFTLVYNKTLFEENSWQTPQSLEELEELLPIIKAKGYTPLAGYGGASGTTTQFLTAFNIFASIERGEIEDPNYRTGRLEPDLNDDTGVYALLKTHKWIKSGYFGNFTSRESVQQSFMTGASAMAILNNNELGELASNMEGAQISTFAIPAPNAIKEQKYVYGGFDGFSIASTTNKVENSKKLVRFLVSKEAQEKFANSEMSSMVNKNVNYKTEEQKRIANEMSFVGKYDIYADYNAGSYGETNGNLLVSFLDKNSATKAEAASLLKTQKLNIEKAMEDSILNKVPKTWLKPTYIKKNWDRTWLTKGLN